MDGHDQLFGRSEGVDGQQAEGGRTVQEDEVIQSLADPAESLLQSGLSRELADQLDLGPGEIDRRGDGVKALDHRVNDRVVHRRLRHEHVIDGRIASLVPDTKASGGISLRIQVYDQDPKAELGE